MTQEEKAQAYDNLIERLKNFQSEYRFETIEKYFPELKESKESYNEKVKDAAIELVRQNKSFNYHLGISKEEVIAWLEKQGEQKSFDDIAKEVTKDKDAAISFLKSTGIINENGELADEYKIEQGEQKSTNKIEPKFKVGDKVISILTYSPYYITEVCNGYYLTDVGCHIMFNAQDNFELSKQETVDKAEPKFHEGDWLIYENGSIYYVNKVYEHTYELVIDNGDKPRIPHELIDKKARFWAIQDAKDGDVLYINNTMSKSILIYKSFNRGIINKYASYSKFGFEGENYLTLNDGYIIPATKEQRGQLEKAMADAGYTFDFEKKELKKIEQKSVEWSEQDEMKYNNIIALVEGKAIMRKDIKGLVNWLKSLKDRYTWKPSDEQ